MKKAFLVAAVLVGALYAGRLVWGEVAYRYFRHQCETRAGEFIYQTVDDVEGLYQMRLRDPKDYIDRIRRGDIPEDPFGHTNTEAQTPWELFLANTLTKYSYKFFETTLPPRESLQRLRSFRFENVPEVTGEHYWIYERTHDSLENAEHNNVSVRQISKIRSRYGFTWREIRSAWDRAFGVWGGETVAVDLDTGEELAIRRGFILWATFSDKTGICPDSKTDMTTGYFVKSVLKPSKISRR
tara:strand:- start:2118 stop:2840 length:723 start_codon:yes stop_codon:yes gene_type:complete